MNSRPFPYGQYDHIKCETCGSVVGMYDNTNYTCDTCGLVYPLSYIGDKADTYLVNSKTGWIFPMIRKGEIRKW